MSLEVCQQMVRIQCCLRNIGLVTSLIGCLMILFRQVFFLVVFPSVICVSVYVHCFFFSFFLWLLRFCVFSPLNHSTFYSDSSLDLHSVDLQSCSQDLSNFSINSFKWCSAT